MILVPTQLLQALHDYLMTRPMAEVEQMALSIRQCKTAPPVEAAPEPADEAPKAAPRRASK